MPHDVKSHERGGYGISMTQITIRSSKNRRVHP